MASNVSLSGGAAHPLTLVAAGVFGGPAALFFCLGMGCALNKGEFPDTIKPIASEAPAPGG